jgi:hypothetical protein
MSGKFFDSQNGTLTEIFLATGGGGGRRSGAKGGQSGRLTEGPQRLRYATELGDTICLLTNRKMIKIATLIHILTYGC